MSMRSEMKAIADSKHADKVEFQNKVDKLLSEIYKSIYKSAHKGEYQLSVNYEIDNKMIYREVMNLLMSEEFYIEPLRDATTKRQGLYVVSWR